MSKSKLIGIFATEISSRVQSNLYQALHEQAKALGYHLVLFSGTNDKLKLNETSEATSHLYELAEYMEFAAIIIHVESLKSSEMIHYCIDLGKKKGIPVFAYDCETAGITTDDGVITINPDYKQGFADCVKHLIEVHHCRNIFMLAGARNNKYSDDRIEMYRKEMDAHGIPYVEEQIGYGDFWELPAIDAMNKFLDSELPMPEAICCANDSMAVTACKVLRFRGLRVPEDVLVTGFDGIEDGKFNNPVLSTCEPRLDAVADFVFSVLSGREEARSFLIPLEFQPKESCGCNCYSEAMDRMAVVSLLENTRQSGWQDHMLSVLQMQLMDSSSLTEGVEYMNSTLDLFKGYQHLFCIRDDIEYTIDYTEDFNRMRVYLDKDFLQNWELGSFEIEKILPQSVAVFEQSDPGSIFIFRLIHCMNKMYGYHVMETKSLVPHEIRLFGHFDETLTYILESTLRNRRLSQANQKLSEMYVQMSEIYIRDTMTGLYNRHGYYQKLDEYVRRADLCGGYVHLISVDMDGMKIINDNYGHLEGDNAIKAVAETLKDCFAQPCISARFGGDEFTVALFTESEIEPTAEKISQKLNKYLETIPQLASKEYSVSVSVGQAVARLKDISDFKKIEKLADDAMYQNKRDRKKGRS